MTHVPSKLGTLVVIATSQTCPFSQFLQLPSSGEVYSTWLEQLLKYQGGGGGGGGGSPYYFTYELLVL